MERSTEAAVEGVLEALTSRGWRFRDLDEEVRALIRSYEASSSSSSSLLAVEMVESELLNMDLRSFGGKSIPDASSLKKFSHLRGPIVLQVVSSRDIYLSSIDGSFKNSQYLRRLLRLGLTDGHSEVIAIEYAPIPSITEVIIPGTKVRLEKKIPIHNGILCLNSEVVTVMGGTVQSLHEEWRMSQKYSGFSRLAPKLSQNDDGAGPPPFEKLHIGARPYRVDQLHSSHEADGKQVGRKIHLVVDKGHHSNDPGANNMTNDPKDSVTERAEDKPCSSDARPKEVSEAVPVQNQAAAQKLLQKMSQPSHEDKHPRGHKNRYKARQEETPVFTLDEWERRKGTNWKPMVTGEVQDVSHDEALARQLQSQLDLEDIYGKTGQAEAEQLRMSMFNFGGAEEGKNDGRREFRGRGRGRRRFR
ncbi:recQ-mediated genome instability protein 1 [Phoenix dactylifera]|uniref:RecQ-mediated genome instability protein 1 n=1 Tax=Phoenix dactylifera TaxID=42345 RepID=A0A8B9AQW7_PHODC|nr:recQ-mediated genome instability protein 1 [Phoenix dactylifera]XP_038986404.1 recQ-mediated genome instability protein 1 [Phoenix dactylifera]XP_038986405.1 recQ-mediated genome instability protein 1 [Phoenix dactylifera]XP_038986406.1 recQ-mediated genome instability protein 1 [Phoenix dactylifera]XP_038986407.1 recQ-mediated genome instability protein 1 [Phoenix dactylifera]XP_038986408.1 recQ-mediated genome instability protein 1 [Phoenix dactylifera]XP_038986409.1 recQ-mediated genome